MSKISPGVAADPLLFKVRLQCGKGQIPAPFAMYNDKVKLLDERLEVPGVFEPTLNPKP